MLTSSVLSVMRISMLLSLCLLIAPSLAVGQADAPQVGLVLSGGGAKGAAHIGVLKVLEELNVPIDYIAGTSMGAVVGGLYATGLSPAEIEDALRQIDWVNIFIDEPERAMRSMLSKEEDLDFLAKVKPRVKEGAVNFAPALIQGQKLGLELRRLTLPAVAIEEFDALPIPFRAVATDAMTGQKVVLGKGDLVQAIRASMAVPMLFAPVEIDEHILIDGGIASNTPIEVVREMGADVVIAVLLGSEPLTAEQLSSPLMMMTQLVNLLTEPNVQSELDTLTATDILITADLRGVDVADFSNMQAAIPRGREAAEQQRDALQALVSQRMLAVPVSSLPKQAPIIEFIDIENNAEIDDAILLARVQQKIGEPLDFAELEAAISRIYGLDIFSNVDYTVIERDGQQGLLIRAEEKAWGTDFIQAGVQLSADLDGDAFFNLGVSFTKQPFNRANARWRTDLALGEEPELTTEIYQPLDVGNRWFARANANWQSDKIKVFDNHVALTEYRAQRYGVQAMLGRNISTWSRLFVSLERATGTAKVLVGDSRLNPEFDFHFGAFAAHFDADSLDNVHFPREGQRLWLSMRWMRDFLGADADFEQVEAAFLHVDSWRDHTMTVGAIYQGSLGDEIPIYARYRLGGFFNLSGLQENELTGEEALLMRLAYQYRYNTALAPLYFGTSLEFGNTWDNRIEWNDIASSVGFYMGAETLLGPVYLGYGIHENQDQTLYLFLGQPWF